MEIYQPSFFDEADRLAKLTRLKDPLVDLKISRYSARNWLKFLPKTGSLLLVENRLMWFSCLKF